MRRLLAVLGATIGGLAGWYLGEAVSVTTAYLLSVVGTGVGIYIGIQIARRNF